MHKYRLISKKGEGTFSEVLKAQSIKNGKYLAIKCMKNHFDSIDQVNNLREIQALRRLSPHPNIIKLYEVLYDQPTGRLALVFELMDMNIYEHIRGRRHYLSESRIKIYMYQLVKAMDHMHRNGIFHRDIKPENILISDDVLKVADFDSCRGIYSKQPYTEYISTRWYRAPECLLTDGYYGYKMDCWGVGCVMFEIIGLFPLFPGTDELDQINKIHNVLGTPSKQLLEKFKRYASHMDFNFPHKEGTGIGKMIPHVTPECVDLITKLLMYNPEDRMSARQALKHPYFREMYQKDKAQRGEKGKEGGSSKRGKGDSTQSSSRQPKQSSRQPSNALSSKNVSTKNVSSKNVSSKNVSSKNVPSKNISNRSIPSKSVSSKNVSGKSGKSPRVSPRASQNEKSQIPTEKSVVLKDKDSSSKPKENRPDRNARDQKSSNITGGATQSSSISKQFTSKQSSSKQQHDAKQQYRRYGGGRKSKNDSYNNSNSSPKIDAMLPPIKKGGGSKSRHPPSNRRHGGAKVNKHSYGRHGKHSKQSKQSKSKQGYGYYGGYQYKQGGGSSNYHGGGYHGSYGNSDQGKYGGGRRGVPAAGGNYRHQGGEYGHHGHQWSKYNASAAPNFTLPGQHRSSKFVLNQPLQKIKGGHDNSNYKKYGNNYGNHRRGGGGGGGDPIGIPSDRAANKYTSPYSQRALSQRR